MLHYLPGNLKKYRILKNLTQENVAGTSALLRRAYRSGNGGSQN